MGPPGSGKSSICRVISGIWKHQNGFLQCPSKKDILFLPQKPYLIPGNLRSQILYPSFHEQHVQDKEQLDEKIWQLLLDVGLKDLIERFPLGLDTSYNWSQQLSLGEQQRLSFARLLFHKPKFAILDESTSALDELNQVNLYKLAQKCLHYFLSIGHRPELMEFHTAVLFVKPEQAGWELKKYEGTQETTEEEEKE